MAASRCGGKLVGILYGTGVSNAFFNCEGSQKGSTLYDFLIHISLWLVLKGDVQMCVTLSLVLRKFHVADAQQEEKWFHAYLGTYIYY